MTTQSTHDIFTHLRTKGLKIIYHHSIHAYNRPANENPKEGLQRNDIDNSSPYIEKAPDSRVQGYTLS